MRVWPLPIASSLSHSSSTCSRRHQARWTSIVPPAPASRRRSTRDASGVDGESARPFLRGECPSDEILVFRHPGSYLARNIAAACALGKNRFAPG